MDPIRSIIAPACKRSRLDKEALAHFIGKAAAAVRNGYRDGGLADHGWLYEALGHLYGERRDQLGEDVQLLFDMYVAEDPSLAYAVEIIDSPLDADRLDYIARDHAHIFLDNRALGTSEVAQAARFIDDGSGVPHLHFSPGSLEKIETFHIYESREKTPYDEMLIHAVLYLFDDFGCGDPALEFHSDYQKRIEVFEEFVQLSDQDLERVFDIVDVTPKRALAQLLIEDVRVNSPFQVVDIQPVPAAGIAAMWYRYNKLSSTVTDAFASLPPAVRAAFKWGAPPDAWRQRREAAARIFEKAAQKEIEIGVDDRELFDALREFGSSDWDLNAKRWVVRIGRLENEEIYWMCMHLGDRITAKRLYEVLLWREFQRRWTGYREWQTRIRKELIERCKQQWLDSGNLEAFVAEVDEVIASTPLIFVSCTRITGSIIDIVLRNRGEEGPVRVWDDDDQSQTVKIKSAREGKSSYYAMLLAPSSLDGDAVSLLREVWEESVTGLDWWGFAGE